MSRRPIRFSCEGATLFGTIDEARGTTGLLLVSGGNEIRSGSWAGQAQLAAQIAAAGHPVLRFDRRGVGDSEGENSGFRGEEADVAAALAAFRLALPRLQRVVGFGNCDAASALMLSGEAGFNGLVLANPWVLEGQDQTVQAPAAIRQRYAEKLANPKEWLRLLSGGVNLRKLASGLLHASAPAPRSTLAEAMKTGLANFGGPVSILLASRDRTAQMFAAAWPSDDARVRGIDSASHSFSDEAAREWLLARILDSLR